MIKRSTMISIRWNLADLEEIEKNVKGPMNPKGIFKDTSDAIREMAKVGAKVMEYQTMMKDPEKADEFRIKMQEMLQTQSMDEWSQTLTTEQIDGFLMFLKLEKDRRYEQKQFN